MKPAYQSGQAALPLLTLLSAPIEHHHHLDRLGRVAWPCGLGGGRGGGLVHAFPAVLQFCSVSREAMLQVRQEAQNSPIGQAKRCRLSF